MFKCEFCNKQFKTENGYKKHLCEKKNRYINFNQSAYNIYKLFLIYSKTKMPVDVEKNKMNFISSKLYNEFVNIAKWVNDIQCINVDAYIKFLIKESVLLKDWTNSKNYHCFLFEYLRNELSSNAIDRSEKYLKSINETIETISPYDLYTALYFGKISIHYIKKYNVDYKNIIDIVIDNSELRQLEFFLEN